MPPGLPQVWALSGTLNFLSLRAPSKSHATLLTTGILAYEINMPNDRRRDLV